MPLYRLVNALHVQYNRQINNTFTVWNNNGNSRLFKSAPNGLYYYDTGEVEETILAMTDLDADQIETAKNNISKYNQRQISGAKAARYF